MDDWSANMIIMMGGVASSRCPLPGHPTHEKSAIGLIRTQSQSQKAIGAFVLPHNPWASFSFLILSRDADEFSAIVLRSIPYPLLMSPSHHRHRHGSGGDSSRRALHNRNTTIL